MTARVSRSAASFRVLFGFVGCCAVEHRAPVGGRGFSWALPRGGLQARYVSCRCRSSCSRNLLGVFDPSALCVILRASVRVAIMHQPVPPVSILPLYSQSEGRLLSLASSACCPILSFFPCKITSGSSSPEKSTEQCLRWRRSCRQRSGVGYLQSNEPFPIRLDGGRRISAPGCGFTYGDRHTFLESESIPGKGRANDLAELCRRTLESTNDFGRSSSDHFELITFVKILQSGALHIVAVGANAIRDDARPDLTALEGLDHPVLSGHAGDPAIRLN